MRLLGEDSLLLSQLIETAGTIVICSQEKTDFGSMVEHLLLFFEPLRTHKDVIVRRSVLRYTMLVIELLNSVQATERFDYLQSWCQFLQGLSTLFISLHDDFTDSIVFNRLNR